MHLPFGPISYHHIHTHLPQPTPTSNTLTYTSLSHNMATTTQHHKARSTSLLHDHTQCRLLALRRQIHRPYAHTTTISSHRHLSTYSTHTIIITPHTKAVHERPTTKNALLMSSATPVTASAILTDSHTARMLTYTTVACKYHRYASFNDTQRTRQTTQTPAI